MILSGFFSNIRLALKSIVSYKRRTLSIGAGMVLGAAIFSSIFFYGSIVNAITIQDIVNNIEAEVVFSPTELNLTETPNDIEQYIVGQEEIEDTAKLYGLTTNYNYPDNTYIDLFMFPTINLTNNPLDFISYSPSIADANDLESEIIQGFRLASGEIDFENDGCLLSIEQYRRYGISLGDVISFNLSFAVIQINPATNEVTGVLDSSSSILNLTVNGFFREGYFDANDVVFSSDTLSQEMLDDFIEYNYYTVACKLNYNELPVSNINDLNDAITRVIQRIERNAPGSLEGYSLIEGLLMISMIQTIIMQIIDTILYIPAILLSMILINFGAELALQERKYEVAVLKAQGASPKQIKRMIYTEVILIGILGEIIGLGLGTIGASTVISTYKFMVFDLTRFGEAFSVIRLTPAAIITTVVITLGILLITTNRKTRDFIAEEVAVAKTIDRKKVGWFKRIYGDVIFFFLGLVGVLLTFIQDVNPEVSFGFGVQLIQFFAPVVLWYGAASVTGRIAVKIPEYLDKFIVRIFKDIGILLKGSLSRRHQNFPRITVLLSLAISLSILAAVQGATGTASLERNADFIVGGDMRIELLTEAKTIGVSNFTGYEDQIESVIPIYYAQVSVGRSRVNCYGADISKYAEQALWHKDSLIGHRNWEDGLALLTEDPTRNFALDSFSAQQLEVKDNPDIVFTNSEGEEIIAKYVLSYDHAPAVTGVGNFGGYNIIVDKQFMTTHFPNATILIRAIVNLKNNVDPAETNLAYELTTSFDWVNEAFTYGEVLSELEDAQGRFFGIPGLLSINFIVALITSVIGVFIFMYMIINRRRKEFAILIAEGASRRQLIQLVISEILSMAIFATVFGSFIGFLLAYQFNGFFEAFDISSFNRMLVLPADLLLLTISISFLAIILATLIPAIAASRTKVVEEMRIY